MLQIGAALFYYKSGKKMLQIEAASFLQIGTSVVTDWGNMVSSIVEIWQHRVFFEVIFSKANSLHSGQALCG